MKRVIPLLLLLAIGGAVVYFHPQWFRKPAAENVLKLSGNIEAHESLVSFKVTGRIIDLPVDEGMTMKAGDLLARLDNDDYRQQVAVDESAIRVRDRQLALVWRAAGRKTSRPPSSRCSMLRPTSSRRRRIMRVTRRFTKRTKSRARRATWPPPTSPAPRLLMIARSKSTTNSWKERAKKNWPSTAPMFTKPTRTCDMSRIRLTYTVLRAPFNGVVLVRQAELGEVVSPGTPIVTLADLDHLWVRVYVPETDLGKVHWGQAVDVRTDTYPDKIYHGRISFISSEAEFTPKSVQTEKERVTLVYRVKVDVENPNHELKPGMPADADIKLK